MDKKAATELLTKNILAARAIGDSCSGYAFGGSSMTEWKEVFNDAAQSLHMPVVHVPALKGGALQDLIDNMNDITDAFQQSQKQPTIVCVDTTGNDLLKGDGQMQMQISNYIGLLAAKYPNAIHVQVVPNGQGTQIHVGSDNPRKAGPQGLA